MHAQQASFAKIAGGDWSEETRGRSRGHRGVRRGLRLRPRRGRPPLDDYAPLKADAAERRPTAGGAAEAARGGAAAGLARMHATAMASQRDVKHQSARSRTSRRSRVPWRRSPPRACAAPSSASRRCALRGRDPPHDAPGRTGRRRRGSRLPLLHEHESTDNVGLLLVTGDRGLAGGFNSQIIRAGVRIARRDAEDKADRLVSRPAAAASPR